MARWTVTKSEKKTFIPVKDLPKGRIGKVTGSAELYVFRDDSNNENVIAIWPREYDSEYNMCSVKRLDTVSNWEVEVLPLGTEVKVTF